MSRTCPQHPEMFPWVDDSIHNDQRGSRTASAESGERQPETEPAPT